MKTLTEIGLGKQIKRFSDSIDHAEYKVNGKSNQTGIFKKELKGDTVRIFVYLDDDVIGDVTEISLIDDEGDVVARAVRTFTKPEYKGLYSVFSYRFIEVDVEED